MLRGLHTILRLERQGKPRHWSNCKSVAPVVTKNIKQSPTPTQTNRNPHNRALFTSVSVTQNKTCPSFNNRRQVTKKKKKESGR
jgi:hypothetical protein